MKKKARANVSHLVGLLIVSQFTLYTNDLFMLLDFMCFRCFPIIVFFSEK
jgi:hypothetical protein